jgi:hypothetical protein
VTDVQAFIRPMLEVAIMANIPEPPPKDPNPFLKPVYPQLLRRESTDAAKADIREHANNPVIHTMAREPDGTMSFVPKDTVMCTGEAMSSALAWECETEKVLSAHDKREVVMSVNPFAHRGADSTVDTFREDVVDAFMDQMRYKHGKEFNGDFIDDETCFVLTQSATQPSDSRGHVARMGAGKNEWSIGHMPSMATDATAATMAILGHKLESLVI